MNQVVIGLDLSLSGLGMVAVPAGWDLRWKQVSYLSLAAPPKDRSVRGLHERYERLARDVSAWVNHYRLDERFRMQEVHVWIEQLPGHVPPKSVPALKKSAGLHAVVVCQLLKHDIEPRYVDESTARKFLLGKLPRSNRKEHVVEALKAAGDPFNDNDQRDAFTIANWGLSELGAPALAHLLFRPEAAE